jgi:hypothetical protein
MSKDISFYGPFLKTERAEDHIHELERVFWSYIRQNEQALRRNRYRQMRERGRRGLGLGFPVHTPTILGDALHNLRAALDHAYCILVEANGHTINDWSTFPISKSPDWQSLKGSVEGKAKAGNGLSQAMIDFIFSEIQPYPGGKGEDLVQLHVLDLADKHTVLLPTEQHTHVEDVAFDDGSRITGITFVTQGDPAIELGEGVGFEPKHHHKAAFEICFGGGKPYEGQPILPILKGLSARVNEPSVS